MKIHLIRAWVCTGPNFNGIVYSKAIMLDKLAAGCDVEMKWQHRVCVLDRPEAEREDLITCYMCEREESNE